MIWPAAENRQAHWPDLHVAVQRAVTMQHEPCYPRIDAWWRRHFADRAQWTSGEAQVSAWSTAGLTARLSVFDRLRAEVVTGPGLAVLDLGCGAGTYVGLLAGQGHHVTAIDYALPMVRRARTAHGGACFVAGDGQRLPFRPASFDLVLCIGVLQCCERPGALIAEAARLVRPGGTLLVESLNPLHFVVPGLKLLELVRRRLAAPVVRHPARAVERWLEASGIEVRGRTPIYVAPSAAAWPAGLMVRTGRRLPGLRRFAATAIWWHGRRRSDR